MSIISKIPPNSKFITFASRFTATYNAQTNFKYDFTKEGLPAGKTNANVFVIDTVRQYWYLLERHSFTFTVPESDYVTAVGQNPIPRLRLSLKNQQNVTIIQNPIQVGAFIKDSEELIFFNSPQSDILQATFTGLLDQPGSLIPFPVITGVFSGNIYQITNKNWIENVFGKGTGGDIGRELTH